MEATRFVCEKPKSARKLYESCDSTQVLSTKKSRNGCLSNNMRFYSMNDYYSPFDNFIFPPPPQHHQIINNPLRTCSDGKNEFQSSSDDADTNSDSSQSDCYPLIPKSQCTRNALYKFRGYLSDGSPVSNILSILPPIGVFWDIENCQVPKGRSAVVIAQAIRDKFFHGYRETEFLVVCDVKKENAQVIQELNDAQVNLIHVSSQSKNAADDKLRQAMRRFADIHGPPAAIMLISGDINFSSDLCDLRHRKKIHVILLHNDLCSQSLILCANEHHNYSKLVDTLPLRGSENQQNNNPVEFMVTNLPLGYDPAKIRNKLKRLSENCGGRVGIINEQSTTIRFSSMEFATRAQKRMNRERVFGNFVFVSTPYSVHDEQDTSKSAGKKTNVWKSYETAQDKEKMYHYLSNGNRTFANGNTSDLFSNDYRPHMAHTKPMYYQNGFANCRNGSRSNNYQNINQENIYNSPHMPPWYLGTPNKHTCENNVKRPVLATCDGNVKCVSTDTFPMSATGKPDYLRNGNGSVTQFAAHQSTYNNQRSNNTPTITILKRDAAVPLNSQDVNKLNGGGPSSQFNGNVRRNNAVNSVDNTERYFHPISSGQQTTNNGNQSGQSQSPVELHVTNLDQTMDPIELRNSLLNSFREFIPVLNLSVFTQSDGNYAASVKVRSYNDSQLVISKLHRFKRIGQKKIGISYAHSGAPHNIALIKSLTKSLLSDVPGHQLPLFTFRELYEKRFNGPPSVSDLYKLKDICEITEETNGGRCISLHPDLRNSSSSPVFTNCNDNCLPAEQTYCKKHWKQTKISNDQGWAEYEISSLPNAKIKLAEFSKHIHNLIATHNSYLLLASFCDCYEAECGELPYDDNGVPVEHLVTCVSGVELVTNASTGIKYLTTSNKNFDDKKSEGSQSLDSNICVSPSLANNLTLFSRELVDLLKTFPHCMMSFNKFIPAYHHHFGRQCRVADYGHTKLIDLMEALPNVVQVLGEGNRRTLTLAHRAQVRRFTSDLLRVLKSVASKQTTLADFPSLFEKTLARPFDAIDYGLCNLEDLLSQVSENTVVISSTCSIAAAAAATPVSSAENTIIAIPKREQTAEEIERTKVFASEVIELLGHAPQCSMLFNKFIPAYHHHYGHQCKVSDFGFTKLIELFEAVPDIVKIEDDPEKGDRRVTLKEDVKLKVLGDQLASLIMAHRPNDLSLSNLSSVFLWQYGYSLKSTAYGFQSMEELIKNMNFAVKIVNTPLGPVLQAVDKNLLKFLSLKTKRVLIEKSNIGQMLFHDFSKHFTCMFDECIELDTLEKQLSATVTVVRNSNNGDAIVKLTPLEVFARDVYLLLVLCDGKLPLNSFENAYLRMYGTAVQPAIYGQQTSQALLQAIPQTIVLRGKPPKRIILLNKELASVGFHLPKGLTSNNNSRGGSVGVAPKETTTRYHCNPSNGNDTSSGTDNNQQQFANGGSNSDMKAAFFKRFLNKTDSGGEKVLPVMLPDLTLHPNTFTASPLTSPHKTLHNTIMYAEHMLHVPGSRIEVPNAAQVPFPSSFFTGPPQPNNYRMGPARRERYSVSVSNGATTSSEESSGAGVSASNGDADHRLSNSVESSSDSFSDGGVCGVSGVGGVDDGASSKQRKVRLAAHFQGYSADN